MTEMENDTRGRPLLVFDGDCGICTWFARWSERHFSNGELTQAWQLLDPGVFEHFGLRQRDVQDAAWWVDDSGIRERGHRAVGRALAAAGGLWRILDWFVLTPPRVGWRPASTEWLFEGVTGCPAEPQRAEALLAPWIAERS
jgi:predicted DCC family thiol-disulfide oxidoreductase YuxK